MPLEIIRNDLTVMDVDAIVHSTNTDLQAGGGGSGAIYEAAGKAALQQACDQLDGCAVGEVVRTEGFGLPAAHIIHTVAPVWKGGRSGEEMLLRSCYKQALALAASLGCKSIAFPLLASGAHGYPKEQALQTAISEIHRFLLDHELFVYLVVFDREAFRLSENLYRSVSAYIDEHYVEEREHQFYRRQHAAEAMFEAEIQIEEMQNIKETKVLEDLLSQLAESFSERLLRFIDNRGMTDVQAYKRANIDRKLFSKIRSSKGYTPLKKTAVAFAIALRLDLKETESLLSAAGYTLSPSSKFDVIIEFFIKQGNYDIDMINLTLFQFDEPTLGQ